MPTGSATDFTLWYQQVMAENAKVSKYEDIFTNAFNTAKKATDATYTGLKNNTTTFFNTQENLLNLQSNKDISSAYANHLHQAMALKHADNLAAGSKNQLLEESKFDTSQAIDAYKKQLENNIFELQSKRYSELQGVTEQYQKSLQNVSDNITAMKADSDKQAAAFGKRAATIDKEIINIIAELYGEDPHISDMFKYSVGGELLGLSELANDLLTDDNGKLTEAGKEWYKMGLYEFDQIAKSKLSPEEFAQYEKDRTLYNEMWTDNVLNPYDPKKATAGLESKIRESKVNRNIQSANKDAKYLGNVNYNDVKDAIGDQIIEYDGDETFHYMFDDETAKKVWSLEDYMEVNRLYGEEFKIKGPNGKDIVLSEEYDQNPMFYMRLMLKKYYPHEYEILINKFGNINNVLEPIDPSEKMSSIKFKPEVEEYIKETNTFGASLWNNPDFTNGDVFQYDNNVLYVYYDGKAWELPNTLANRKKLGLSK